MNDNYMKALNVAEEALNRINIIYEKSKIASFEDIKGCKATEKVIEDLEDFIKTMEHYSKKTKEGYLELNSNGRYELKGIELTCGYPVELWNDKSHSWNDGRIGHSEEYGGYYFYNYDEEHAMLSDGIKARVRI
ncbi:DUF5348 domain-containing protein [Clostridium scatologenes]|uniref:DUF5348 domain-containing protein n=1 Tax=Clostridium scatologenes TaxID=1548 RepID=A0A0E3JRV0_CLOSL|nr:DUF5348 domain-containing protein [Clostridium scatologenes]AKA71948.1 hypothetical protein CSCA_4823 [Clostridium scatologenes]